MFSSLAPLLGPVATLAIGAVLVALVVMVIGVITEHGDAIAFDSMTRSVPGSIALRAASESRPAA